MRVYLQKRGTGKTTKLIKDCSIFGGYIVCPNRQRAGEIFKMSKKIGWEILFPLTFDEFLDKGYMGLDIKHFYIDDVDLLLARLSLVPILSITLTDNL